MSGQLVGEVLDAAEAGQLDKLSPPARWTLVVIAERCHHISRQGSVRRARIQAAIGAHNSLRTVSRAVCELRDAGFIRIVKNGYKAPGQLPRAAVYELAKLTPPKDGASLEPSSRQNQPSSRQNRPKLTPSMDGALDGSYDGTLDGKEPPLPPKRSSPAQPVTKRRPKTAADKRGHYIPEDWQPTPATIAWAREKYPNLDLRTEFDKFMNHWLSASGQNARKRDWDRALKNWFHNAHSGRNGQRRTRSTSDTLLAQTQALKHQPPQLELG
jgi:hypothetical protein